MKRAEHTVSFRGFTVVSCGTLSPELNALSQTGFLDADKILYTIAGLHENNNKLKQHLTRQLHRARQYSDRVIVVYGDKCYINMATSPPQLVDDLIEAHETDAHRLEADNCVDMICSRGERDRIRGGDKVYWLTPGWLKYWKIIFEEWDQGKANETFPKNDSAVLLDGVDMYNDYAANYPEKLLEFSDWMGIPIVPHPVELTRLKTLLTQAVEQYAEAV